MDSKSIIIASFLLSSALHVPLYAFVDSFYFPDHSQQSVEKTQPTFTYVPLEREVRVTKVQPSYVEQRKESNPIKQIAHTNMPPKKGSEPTKDFIDKTDADILDELLALTPKAAVSRVIPPTVDDLDLSNTTVREAFFSYYDLLSTLIARFAVYPEDARIKRIEGVAYVSFLLRQNGSLGDVLLRQSSGNGLLDRSALSAVQNAAPFPPLPIELHRDRIRINVPISFEID
jgi:TonB family protein